MDLPLRLLDTTPDTTTTLATARPVSTTAALATTADQVTTTVDPAADRATTTADPATTPDPATTTVASLPVDRPATFPAGQTAAPSPPFVDTNLPQATAGVTASAKVLATAARISRSIAVIPG